MMEREDIYTISELYDFQGCEEGVTIALFAILKELKKLNKTLKEKNNASATR